MPDALRRIDRCDQYTEKAKCFCARTCREALSQWGVHLLVGIFSLPTRAASAVDRCGYNGDGALHSIDPSRRMGWDQVPSEA